MLFAVSVMGVVLFLVGLALALALVRLSRAESGLVAQRIWQCQITRLASCIGDRVEAIERSMCLEGVMDVGVHKDAGWLLLAVTVGNKQEFRLWEIPPTLSPANYFELKSRLEEIGFRFRYVDAGPYSGVFKG